MFFLAQFVHRDLDAWREHLQAHMGRLDEQERAGTVAASGPLSDPDEPGVLAVDAPARPIP